MSVNKKKVQQKVSFNSTYTQLLLVSFMYKKKNEYICIFLQSTEKQFSEKNQYLYVI